MDDVPRRGDANNKKSDAHTPYSYFRIKLGSNVNLNAAFSFRSEKYYLGKFAAFCRTRAQ
jgi:hypothetical protein